MLIQRIFYVCLVILIALPGLGSAAPALPNVSAKSAIVIEAATGKIIYEKKATQAMYPASTTKIMTLIAALEQGNLEDVLTVSANAANTEGSSIYLEPGERLKLLEVLYGVMLHSGNDATVAVAEHISGSVEKFSRLMTDKARAIGAAHTNFTNPNGLPDPNHYTTAHDLAKITAYGYRNPLFRKIVGTRHQTIPWNNKGYDRDLYNENKLTLAQVTEIFLTTENYLFRRTMCDLPTNALNKIFLMLHREIIRYDGTEDNYVEKLKYALLSKKERARFPDDVEFKAAFEERPVYLMNSKNRLRTKVRFNP